jgi:hypothetical protein
MNVRGTCSISLNRRSAALYFGGQANDKRAGCRRNERGRLTRDVFPDCHLQRL